MAFPDTPNTLISKLHMAQGSDFWQKSWQKFFDLYHAPIEVATLHAYSKNGWYSVSDELLEDTMSDIFLSLFKAQEKDDYDKSKSYRNYIGTIVYRRVVDRIRKMKHAGKISSLDMVQENGKTPASFISDDFVDREFRKSLLATMLEDVSRRVSPQYYEIFERAKLIGEAPEELAESYGVTRNYIDNAVYKVMKVLKELALCEDYQKEFK
jgi:RNA polymerase sigma factor (sigma-70 family)